MGISSKAALLSTPDPLASTGRSLHRGDGEVQGGGGPARRLLLDAFFVVLVVAMGPC